MVRAAVGIRDNQHQQTNAGSVYSGTSDKAEHPKDGTNLKLMGFSIEVEIKPITLVLETDKGPFSLEMTGSQLAKLSYALRFVDYAEEPLQRKQLKKQAEASKGNTTARLASPSRANAKKRRKEKK